jgi:hypothetical protein
LQKLVAIVGGFIIMAGIILLGVAALAVAGYLNVDILFENKYLWVVAALMIAIGLLDAFAAIIVARW